MPKRVVHIQAPTGGLYKRRGFQSQPPFTTPNCDNVRIDDSIDGRERIGSRPGVKILSSGTPPTGTGAVKLLSSVRWGAAGSEAETLVLAIASVFSYSTNNGSTWSATSTGLRLSPSDINQYTAADYHKKLYIANGTATFAEYNPSDNTLNQAPTVAEDGGEVPGDCEIIVRYRDRILLAGDRTNPQVWHMSRSGNALDWNTDATDVLSAVSGTTSDAGSIGEAIRCAIPHGDDCIIFGCDSSIWTLRSDPNFGGTLDNLSQRIGIIDKHAWARTPEGWLFFLTQDGIYAMQPGCGDVPISVSRERLPEELIAVDRTTTVVSMDYDIRFRGIHLWLTPESGTATHYFLDVKQLLTGDSGTTATFWPQTLTSNPGFQPYSAYTYEPLVGANISSSLMGGRNGVLYVFDKSENAIDEPSYVEIGPLSTTGQTGQYFTGTLDILHAVLSDQSNTVTWKVRSGETPEAAFDATTEYEGKWDNVRNNHTVRIRLRNPYYIIRIENLDSSNYNRWSVESLTAVVNPRGKQRFRR